MRGRRKVQRFWTHQEIDRLVDLYSRNTVSKKIAADLDRSPGSIDSMIYRLVNEGRVSRRFPRLADRVQL